MLNDDSILYHYCSVDVFVNILKTHSIWLTHAREMNDFHEDILFRKPLKTALQSFVNRSEPERQLLQQIVDEYTKRADFPYVACFSRDKDMLSQWRAYADNGKGVAIGVKLGELPHFDLLMQKHGECISKPVIKAHGSSDAKAFKNAIRQAKKMYEEKMVDTIKAYVENLK